MNTRQQHHDVSFTIDENLDHSESTLDNDDMTMTHSVRDDDIESDTESSSDSSAEGLPNKKDRAIFKKARKNLNPSPFFRGIVSLYAQRKMNIFFCIHFISTIVIWIHFAFIKFDEQAEKVPMGAHRYWLKRLVPPIEFGSMHAILFQMALIPITMCRCSISALAESVVQRVIPLNRALAMHIHLGYTMIIIVFFATIFFFFFFGLLCSEGEQAFCDKFTMEIMITGYCILGTLLLIGITSHFRHKIPYEIFYAIHHVVFLMYIITIAHTLDIEQRKGRSERSQTFKWFSSTLLYYFCDRVAMHMNHRYNTNLVSSSVVWGNKGSKLIILKVERPALFQFKPGQYAYLRFGKINNEWHPFSIASRSDSSHLEFYIEVYEGKTWTKSLWNLFDDDGNAREISMSNLRIEVMGPYGTSLTRGQNYSHVVAIGAGTGVVPILSMYKEHMHKLFRLDPTKFFAELEESERKLRRIERAQDAHKGSLFQQLRNFCYRERGREEVSNRYRTNTAIQWSISNNGPLQSRDQDKIRKKMLKSAALATLPIYGTVMMSSLPVIGVALFALMISWSTITIDIYPPLMEFIKYFTIFFQACFAFAALFIWNADSILSFVDVVMVLIAPFADWYWIKVCNDFQTLFPADLIMYSILIWYMIGRLWVNAVSQHQSARYRAVNNARPVNVDYLKFVWTTRSASQASEILPDILRLWDLLVEKWGPENALKVCNISVHVTDPNELSCALLRKEYENTDFYRNGGIMFRRPRIRRVIEDHTIELINSRVTSHSLLAFCGSPSLSDEIHYRKISNDVITAMTGHCQSHMMDFVSESYGGRKVEPVNENEENYKYFNSTTQKIKREKMSLEIDDDSDEGVEVQLLTKRKTLSYYNENCLDCLSFIDGSKSSTPSTRRRFVEI